MLYICIEDFYTEAQQHSRLTKEEELDCARKMAEGDLSARSRIVQSYLPTVAGHIKRLPQKDQTLYAVYHCLAELEKAVDSFDFLQSRETFPHHLSRYMRQAVTKCIAHY